MNERQLLASLKKGDETAFDAIFKKYASDVYYFSFDMMRNEAEAEEIVQETFLKVWEVRRTVDPDLNFSKFLITIAKNKIYNSYRRKVIERKYGRAVDASLNSAANIEQELYLEDLRKLLLKGIDRLLPQQREVLTLKSQGLGNDEISEKLGIPKKTVENHLYKAYRQLRGDMNEFREIIPFMIPLIICLL